ncbi:MAG: glycosyltransferase [Coriobacteriales bacterium]|jgi:glycosyltransferase involved in cell wall biosynthesis|nr:glycosyltransferase [Coriobacteriales bacterium]
MPAPPSAADVVSVVLPVHDGADDLPACLDALLGQEGTDIQVVAVDDGSTDASGSILDSYAACRPALTVVHTENHGAGRARLTGLAHAQGSHIGFCDCGDRPAPNMYATLLGRAQEASADLVVCGFRRVDAADGRLLSEEMCGLGQGPCDIDEDPGILLAVNTAVWNKLYRAASLKDTGRVPVPPRVGEDVVFQLLAYPHVGRIACVAEPLYEYRVRPGSLMSDVGLADLDLLRLGLLEAKRLLAEGGGSEEMQALYDLVAFTHLGVSLPLRLEAAREMPLSQALGWARAVLERDFPRYSRSRFCSPGYVLGHRGRNLGLSGALLCQRLHLMLPLLGLLRQAAVRRWGIRYW